MINNISQKIAETLCEYIERTTEVDYLRYGVEIIIRGFIKIFTLLTAAFFLGLFLPMISVLFTFILFRCLTGGHHYSTYLRCLSVGLIVMLSFSLIATKIASFIDFYLTLTLLFFTILVGMFFSYKYAPSNHFYKKMTERHKKILKKYSLVAIIIWGFALYYLIYNSYSSELVLASLFGFLFQIGSIHPYSYIFVNKIELLLERGNNL